MSDLMLRLPVRLLCAAALTALVPLRAGAEEASPATPSAEVLADRAALAEQRATLQALIDSLVRQGLLSRARADELLRRGRAEAVPPAQPNPEGGPAVIRVPYLADSDRQRLRDELRTEVLAQAQAERWAAPYALPRWAGALNFDGDVRLRLQADLFDDANLAPELFRAQTDSPAWAPDLSNTRNDRARMTLRARFGIHIKASDSLSAGLRIATGSSSGSANSESLTLGTQSSRLAIALDRAFLRWQPDVNTRYDGGRMAVPFEHTDLSFPDDLSVDGVAGRWRLPVSPWLMAQATLGAFPLEELANTRRDKYLFGAQMGLEWAPAELWRLRGSLALYNFKNIEGVRESELPPTGALSGTTGYQSSQYPSTLRQKGNTLINLNAPASTAAPVWGLASKFKPLNLTLGVLSQHYQPWDLGLTVDLIKNTAFDLKDIEQRAGTNTLADLRERSTGLQARVHFGHDKVQLPGDWQVQLAWRRFERDAWVDGYTDSAWHLGGTNHRGFSLGGQYAFDPRATLGLRLTSTRNLDDGVRYTDSNGIVSGNLSSAPLRIDVVQLDATLRF